MRTKTEEPLNSDKEKNINTQLGIHNLYLYLWVATELIIVMSSKDIFLYANLMMEKRSSHLVD